MKPKIKYDVNVLGMKKKKKKKILLNIKQISAWKKLASSALDSSKATIVS